jgi:oligopeptide transport system permease protein
MQRQFGLDQPLWQQYFNYLYGILHGDFGPSFVSPNFTVYDKFANGLPVSIQLGLSALVLALILGGILGIIAALNQNKLADYAVIATATAGSTIPTFVIAPLIQLLFGLTWKLCRLAAGAMAR